MTHDQEFLAIASRLAQSAAGEVMSFYQGPEALLKKQRKEDLSLVTEADVRADAILREGLAKAFPDHAILTEENGIVGPRDAEYLWLVDPLDGTKAFAKGIPGFSVMVGLLKKGLPYLGVVVDPLEGLIYWAVKGEGAFVLKGDEKRRLQVSARRDFGTMPVVVSTGFPEDKMGLLRRTLTGPQLPPINSVGIKVGLVVREKADIYISHHEVHYWDTCAPQVVLEEAGGVFTKLDGSALLYDLTSDFSHHTLTLASNGTRHRELISLIRPIFS